MGVPTKPLRIAILFMSHPSSHLDLVGPPVTHPGCRWAKPAGYTNEVFLGGSCDPTQWRQQSAMPFLERAGISYYNPQVADWHPGLLDEENRAKATAAVLLFVIDNDTRDTSTHVDAGSCGVHHGWSTGGASDCTNQGGADHYGGICQRWRV